MRGASISTGRSSALRRTIGERRFRELDAQIDALLEAGQPVPPELREEHNARCVASAKRMTPAPTERNGDVQTLHQERG